MAKAHTYPPYRGPGAGRPPLVRSDSEPDVLFVEGETKVQEEDAETLEKLGNLRGACEPFGLVVHVVPLRFDGSRRRAWGSARVTLEAATNFLNENPGITFARFAEVLYLANDPMTDLTFAAAKAKARVAVSRLFQVGRIRKERNEHGHMTLWPLGIARQQGEFPADLMFDIKNTVQTALEKAARNKTNISTLKLVLDAVEKVWATKVYLNDTL